MRRNQRFKKCLTVLRLGFLWLTGSVLIAAALVGAAFAFPAPFFVHRLQVGQVRLLSATPLDTAALAYLEGLDLNPVLPDLPRLNGPLDIYIAQGGWRQAFFIDLLANGAGGVTYTPVASQHIFLSGADFAEDVLIRDGTRIASPRSLTYYIRHEVNHLAMARAFGPIRFHLHPLWVTEGIADLAGLGRPNRAEMLHQMGGRPTTLDDMIAFGSYPRERLLADWALYQRGSEFLVNTRIDEAEAWAMMLADGWGEGGLFSPLP